MTDARVSFLRTASVPIAYAEIALPELAGSSALPLVCRWPAEGETKACVVFCHGLGASGSDYAVLSEYWASHGYLVIHPTFPDWVGAVAAAEPELGVDPSGNLDRWAEDDRLRPRLFEILHTPHFWLERIRIVHKILDGLDGVLAGTSGLPARPLPLVIAGHSFGAYTAQLLAGAEIDLPGEGPRNFRDRRFAASILLSAQGRDQQGLRAGSWDGIEGPMLNVTGTRDGGAKGQDWHWKVEPYEFAPAGDKYLAVLTNADHYLGGIARPDQFPVPEQREAVEQLTLAFLETYLVKNHAAKTWLGDIKDEVASCALKFLRK